MRVPRVFKKSAFVTGFRFIRVPAFLKHWIVVFDVVVGFVFGVVVVVVVDFVGMFICGVVFFGCYCLLFKHCWYSALIAFRCF